MPLLAICLTVQPFPVRRAAKCMALQVSDAPLKVGARLSYLSSIRKGSWASQYYKLSMERARVTCDMTLDELMLYHIVVYGVKLWLQMLSYNIMLYGIISCYISIYHILLYHMTLHSAMLCWVLRASSASGGTAVKQDLAIANAPQHSPETSGVPGSNSHRLSIIWYLFGSLL